MVDKAKAVGLVVVWYAALALAIQFIAHAYDIDKLII